MAASEMGGLTSARRARAAGIADAICAKRELLRAGGICQLTLLFGSHSGLFLAV